jgi:hypothetical protein
MATEYIYKFNKAKIMYVDDKGEIQTEIVCVEGELVCSDCLLVECRENSPCYLK